MNIFEARALKVGATIYTVRDATVLPYTVTRIPLIPEFNPSGVELMVQFGERFPIIIDETDLPDWHLVADEEK